MIVIAVVIVASTAAAAAATTPSITVPVPACFIYLLCLYFINVVKVKTK